MRSRSSKAQQVVSGFLAGVVIVAALVGILAVFAVVAAYPTMLVLGALHRSNGMSAVPALGFWQTLGSLFIIGSIGSALGLRSTTVRKGV